MSPGEIDPEVIRRHLMGLRWAVEALKQHRGCSTEDLESDSDLRWAVERGLQLCAQNTLDIATHVAVAAGRDVPDYAAAIDALAGIGALPREFARGFRNIAGFRNVLVHGYLDVDVALVNRLLNERLSDFTEFADYMERLLAAKAK